MFLMFHYSFYTQYILLFFIIDRIMNNWNNAYDNIPNAFSYLCLRLPGGLPLKL